MLVTLAVHRHCSWEELLIAIVHIQGYGEVSRNHSVAVVVMER